MTVLHRAFATLSLVAALAGSLQAQDLGLSGASMASGPSATIGMHQSISITITNNGDVAVTSPISVVFTWNTVPPQTLGIPSWTWPRIEPHSSALFRHLLPSSEWVAGTGEVVASFPPTYSDADPSNDSTSAGILTAEIRPQDVSLTNAIVTPSAGNVGDTVDVSVTLTNNGDTFVADTLYITAYQDSRRVCGWVTALTPPEPHVPMVLTRTCSTSEWLPGDGNVHFEITVTWGVFIDPDASNNTAAATFTLSAPIGTPFRFGRGGGSAPADFSDVCFNPDTQEYFIVYVDSYVVFNAAAYTNTNHDGLYARRVNALTGAVSPPILIDGSFSYGRLWDPQTNQYVGTDIGMMDHPTVAYAPGPGGTGRYAVAYARSVMVSYDWYGYALHARFLDATGADAGGGEVRLFPATLQNPLPTFVFQGRILPVSMGDFASPRMDVAFDGANFVIVWRQATHATQTGTYQWRIDGDIFGQRFTPDGVAVAPPFSIDDSFNDSVNPVVACLPGTGRCLVAYADNATGSEFRHVRCRTVTAATEAVGPARNLSDSIYNNDFPAIAANPTNQEWLVTWEENDPDTDPPAIVPYTQPPVPIGDISFRRVDAQGIPIGAGEVPLQAGPETDGKPCVAWSDVDNQYVVLWNEQSWTYEQHYWGDYWLASFTSLIQGARIAGATDVPLEIATHTAAPHWGQSAAIAAGTGTRDLLGSWSPWAMRLTTPPPASPAAESAPARSGKGKRK